MKTIRRHFLNVLQDDIAVIVGVVSFGLILWSGLIFVDMEQSIGNMGSWIAYTQLVSHWVLSFLFGVFIAATVYKVRWMKQRSGTKTSSGMLGGLVSTVIIGCPACSVSIVSYLGLGGALINLPGFGLEIKLIGVLILVWATWTTLRDLYICKMPKAKAKAKA